MPSADPPSRLALGALAAVVLLLHTVATAAAAQSVSLSASFTPDRLGARTTIGLGFLIGAPAGEVPSALTEIEVRYPPDLGFALSGLGKATCSASALAATGASACPPNSIMGRGDVLAELRFGAQIVRETATIAIARAPDDEGHIALLLYASGPSPVNTQVLSPAQLLPSAPPFGGRLAIQLPLIASVPGAPDIAIAAMNVSIGPRGLTYYEQAGASTLAYAPAGILLPDTCPRGGFPFAGRFSFLDGSRTEARTAVACPAAHRRRSAHRRHARPPRRG